MAVNFLENLMTEQRDMIVSLPYRVGLMIGEVDDTGGDESSEIEGQVLHNLLMGFSRDVFGAETMTYVIRETVQRKDEWANWSQNLDQVPEECAHAVDILSQYVDPKEVSAFTNYLLEIAESVAMAFREYDEKTPLLEKIKMKWLYGRCKAKAENLNRNFKTYDEFLNISIIERGAMEKIAAAMGTVYI